MHFKSSRRRSTRATRYFTWARFVRCKVLITFPREARSTRAIAILFIAGEDWLNSSSSGRARCRRKSGSTGLTVNLSKPIFYRPHTADCLGPTSIDSFGDCLRTARSRRENPDKVLGKFSRKCTFRATSRLTCLPIPWTIAFETRILCIYRHIDVSDVTPGG